MPEARLLICDYSYHTVSFSNSFRNGLTNYLFRLQTEGYSTVVSSGKEYRLQAGDLLLLKPGDDYELFIDEEQSDGRVSSGDYFIFCDGSWIDAWWKRVKRHKVNRISIDEHLLGLWRQLLLEKRRGPEEDPEMTGYLLRGLCLYLDRSITETKPADRTAFMALRLKRFIEEHAIMTFKLEDAAAHVGISLSRAVQLFKATYGKTMIQYALEIRLNAAVERIKYSSMTLEEVAETCGFASYSYFHRVFRARYGMAPVKFRESGIVRE